MEAGAQYRHLKRGTSYTVLATGLLQVATRQVVEGDRMVAYRGAEGDVWFRSEAEFLDGRFEHVADGEQDMKLGPDDAMWGKWFLHDEAPAGSYACLYQSGTSPVSLAWMPAQGRPSLPDAVVMPFRMPNGAQGAAR